MFESDFLPILFCIKHMLLFEPLKLRELVTKIEFLLDINSWLCSAWLHILIFLDLSDHFQHLATMILFRPEYLVSVNIICTMYLGETVTSRKNVTTINKIVVSLNWRSRLAFMLVLPLWITFMNWDFCRARRSINKPLNISSRKNGTKA
ncbi:hypothetical protein BpHYR1_044509 [Brachionus plicatilis]|uniref:Uncharacterized protein n=1 Tax=Brachionus plicatilis TaxID=10195 RepID=A0A3M7SZ35_BRAPC|nr:hypothetical protein BpHYR1_044509 [Brachionus plicatilis]